MTNLARCWAYNRGSERCDKHAGHPGDHAITHTWTDSECFAPNQQPTPHIPAPPAIPMTDNVPAKCVACQHQHKGGPCKCGCHEHIG